jgi:ubiquinone/menaquinone biosynthesis C-methylase UbiE
VDADPGSRLRPVLRRAAAGPLGPRAGEERRIARLLLALAPGDDVLDVGCGSGELLEVFAAAVRPRGRVAGVDASGQALAAAARRPGAAGDVALLRCDAERLPFRAGAFDAVCCAGVLEEAGAPWTLLDELVRVLRPGGRIAVVTTCRTRSSPGRMLDAFLGARAGVRMFEPDEVTDALAARGVDPVQRRVAGLVQFAGGRLGVSRADGGRRGSP